MHKRNEIEREKEEHLQGVEKKWKFSWRAFVTLFPLQYAENGDQIVKHRRRVADNDIVSLRLQ